MKRYSKRGDYNPVADINVIPLMDLTFCLLIIFMLTTPLLEHSLSVKLPRATNAPPHTQKTMCNITIDKTGRVYLDKTMIRSMTELQSILIQRASTDPDLAVLVRADQGVPYGEFVKVVDTLKGAHIEKLGIVTSAEKAQAVGRK